MKRLLLVLAFLAVVLAPTASADESQYTDFYTPPEPSGVAGDVIRTEPSRLVLEPSGVIPGWHADGTRLMYWTADGR